MGSRNNHISRICGDDNRPLLASYHTLGCKLNFAETSTIGKILRGKGVEKAAEGQTPDICIVNTCSVTEMADKKGRSLIRKLHRQWPDASIVVTGCYAQLKPEEVAAIEGVDIVLGSAEKMRIAEYLERWLRERHNMIGHTPAKDIREFSPSCSRGDRTRYFLKVQDGCDYYCSYCTIPFARGRSRSGSIAQILEQARGAALEGGKEIVITGVNTGCFGQDTGEDFLQLLKRLDEIEGIERYRISSIEPNLLTPEIIEWTAKESRAFMPHFHIPLQSGSDVVLKEMRRRYDTALFADRIAAIRELLPDAFIGVDIIAGARGETPEEFQRSRDFAESLDITRLHVFPYSERPGTLALRLDGVVSQEEKHRRVAELQKVSDSKLHQFMVRMQDTVRPVLWEHTHDNEMMTGLTDNYLRVLAPVRPGFINNISKVVIHRPADGLAETVLASHF